MADQQTARDIFGPGIQKEEEEKKSPSARELFGPGVRKTYQPEEPLEVRPEEGKTARQIWRTGPSAITPIEEPRGYPSSQGRRERRVERAENIDLSKYAEMSYTPKDLTKPEFFEPIQRYMVLRQGDHMLELKPEEVVDKFLNTMRGFNVGNSLRTVGEISFLNSLDQERLPEIGEAYEIFNNLSTFGEGETGEKIDSVLDYTREAVLDPVNAASLFFGRVFTSAGFRAGSKLPQMTARKAFIDASRRGATREKAVELGSKVFAGKAQAISAEQAAVAVKRKAIRSSVEKSIVGRIANNETMKEIAVTGAFEGAVSFGMDYLYQDAMIRTLVQDEYNSVQGGISAIASMLAMGAVAGFAGLTKSTSGTQFSELPVFREGREGLSLSKLGDKMREAAGRASLERESVGNWFDDVAKGKELSDLDSDFFIKLAIGDSEAGVDGIAQIARDEGFVWVKENPDEGVSNFLGDLIKQADPEEFDKFLDDIEALTGMSMTEARSLTQEEFANTFKKKFSDQGRVLNAASQAAKILGKDVKDVTVNDYAEYIAYGGKIPEASKKGFEKEWDKIVESGFNSVQNNIIRMMVAHPGTTALNLTGYSAYSLVNAANDAITLALHGGMMGTMRIAGADEVVDRFGLNVQSILRAQKTKALNLLDPNMAYDDFLSYVARRPNTTKELHRVLSGGVEDVSKLKDGFDPDMPIALSIGDQFVDQVQKTALVQAQDMYTKSSEFFYQLEKKIGMSPEDGGFGESLQEFLSRPDANRLMASDRFVKLEAAAVQETLRSVFGKSYRGRDALGIKQMATFIEEARNIPGVGVLVPFGRFFNNTVAFMSDHTGVSLALQATKYAPKSVGDRDPFDLAQRAMIGWVGMAALASREIEYMNMGLSWDQEIDDATGAVITETYEFPYSALKAGSRLMAYRLEGREIPPDVWEEIGNALGGQLTRELGESGEGLVTAFKAIVDPQSGKSTMDVILSTLAAVPAQGAGATTRFLDPYNSVVGLMREEEQKVPTRDYGSKKMNEAVRYIDNFIEVTTGENLTPAKIDATSGKARTQDTKNFSTYRQEYLTATDRVFNMLGISDWKALTKTGDPMSDNRYAEIFERTVEGYSDRLLRTPEFLEGDQETKEYLFKAAMTKARDASKDYLKRLATKEDGRTLIAIELSSVPDKTINRVLKDLGIADADAKNLENLSLEQLENLKNLIDFREQYKTK